MDPRGSRAPNVFHPLIQPYHAHLSSAIRLTVTLHDGKDLDNDLGARTDEDLALSAALGVDDVVLG